MASKQEGKFDKFERSDRVYSTIRGHDIWVSIFTTRQSATEHRQAPCVKVPVLVYWHGGGFIVGDRLYEPWWPVWLLEFALSQDAMIVAPDYRLLPEATGADVMDDMDAFWTWFLGNLPDTAESESWPVQPDINHVICVGHSSGGAIALISSLERPDVGIKAVVSLYGPLYSNVPELKMTRPRKILGSLPPPPREAEANIRTYLQRTKGTIRTQGDVMEMWGLVACILQQGRLPRMVNQKPDARLDPTTRIEKSKICPPIWILHGTDDSVQPFVLLATQHNERIMEAMSIHAAEEQRQKNDFDDFDSLKLRIQGFAANALDIQPLKLQKKSNKSWLALGGDSLTAVNFMGACHEAGIAVDIPHILKAETLGDLIDEITRSHQARQLTSNGIEKPHQNGDIASELYSSQSLLDDEVQGIGPCSPMQENFIALQNVDPRSYQLHLAVRISSTKPEVIVTTDTVKESWIAVVKRHATLRTTFVESVHRSGRLDQVVWKNFIPQISILSLTDAENKTSFENYSGKFPHHLILAEAPENQVFVRLFISHALVDAMSIEILFRDLFRKLLGTLPADDDIQCEDFLRAQQPDTSRDALSYWSSYMMAAEGSFLGNPGLKSCLTGLYAINQEVHIAPELVQNLSDQSNATLVNACQVAWALVLRSYVGLSNVCFSYTASGRQKRIKGLQDAAGNFVNTLPCRLELDKTTTICEALRRAQRDFLDSVPYQGASLTSSQEMGGCSVRQLGDSLLSFQRAVPREELEQAGFILDLINWEAPSDYNYTLAISIDKHKLGLRFSVWESLTSRDDALNMLQLFRDALNYVLQSPGKCCSDFVGLTTQDQTRIVARNESPFAVARSCVHDQVWATTQRQPDSPAVDAWDGQLTYSELNATSRRLAAVLVRMGIRVEDKVGVCMDKSRWVPVVMLAILQAGGVVVPFGNQHPPKLIHNIARDADVSILLADHLHAKRLQGVLSQIHVVDTGYLHRLPLPTDVTWPSVSPDNAAWIVHTSGSTGTPKGVVLEHKTLCAPMHFQASRYKMGPWTRALQFSAHTFDVVVKDIFTTLSIGGCVCIPSEKQRLDDLGTAIKMMLVNFASLTPTVASLLDLRDLPTLETVVLTGEALRSSVIQPWLEGGRVSWFNAYGPSECSHVSTIHGPITQAAEASNIGFPAANHLWITNPLDNDVLSPIGAVGELLIEGAIAREYLHDPGKTAAAFVIDPKFIKRLGLAPGRRMYRTGDLVQQHWNGSLIYLGRRDTQIKIRGQRVEVGEIESRISESLAGSPLVCVDLIKLRKSNSDEAMLMAAIDMHKTFSHDDLEPGRLFEPSERLRVLLQGLLSRLVDELPSYMVPSHIVPFTTLPTNSSGKLDRRATRALLEIVTESELAMFKKNDVIGGVSTKMEEKLREIWAEVLHRPVAEIRNNDHFMHLGGDSVVAMRMAAVARRRDISLSVGDIVQYPRLADMARILNGYQDAVKSAAKDDPVPFELWNGFLTASPGDQEARLASVAEQCNVPPRHIEDVYPASPLQESLMAMTTQSPETYVAQYTYHLHSNVGLDKFQQAWADVASSLPILRTRIVYASDSGSVQVVTRDAPRWTLSCDLVKFIKEDREASFTYGTPLHRFAIVNSSEESKYFVWTAHHSAFDGETVTRTFKILAQVLQGGTCHAVTPIPRFIRYLEEHTRRNEGREKTEAYWRKELENAQLTQFPEAPSPSYRPFADGVLRHRFSRSEAMSSHGSRVSAAILLRAAWALTLSSHTASNEAIMAVVLSGRDMPLIGIEDMVFPTITTVPCRVHIDREAAVVDFLSSIESQSKDMAHYAQFGLANIRRVVPGLGRNFDPGHLFLVQPGGEETSTLQDVGLQSVTGDRGNFEGYGLVVECTIEATGTGVEVEMRFDQSVLPSSQAAALMSQLEHVTRVLSVYNLPDEALNYSIRNFTVGALDLISPEDKKKLLSWNRSPPSPAQATVHGLIGQQIAKYRNCLAVCARDGDLTYSQLDGAANRLSQHLASLGVGPETYVGLCMDKSKYAVVSMLAILRAGGAVVPIGVQYPDSRVETVVSDANMSVALVDMAQVKRFRALVRHPVLVNSDLLSSLKFRPAFEASRAGPNNPAWVIYTSGSTGIPKGVVLEHQALCSSILAHGARYFFGPTTRTLQFSAFTFDVSIQDNMTTLAYGGCICLPSESDRTDRLATTMRDFQVTLATLTPTVTSLLDPESMPETLDTIIFVGEAIKPAAVEPWIGRLKVFNGYGPAECSIYSVINGPMLRAVDAPIIGNNVSNRLWVTNPTDHNALVPIGTPGELLIEGPTLAREYLHDAIKTNKSFVLDPHFIASLDLPPGRRMYRTGDLVVQDRHTGLYECLGRIDTQIKIRGQRVETGEIESHIVRLQPGIHDACVDLVRVRDFPNPMLLVAVEPLENFQVEDDNDTELHNAELVEEMPSAIYKPSKHLSAVFQKVRSELVNILPFYMIPSHFIPMKLPVSVSGKLDRRATKTLLEGLSRKQLRAFSTEDRSTTVEDRMLSDAEEQLRLLWAEVLGLGVERIETKNDDFFQLGGDSIAAMRLVAAARRAPIPMQLGVRQILQNPRLADMAQSSSKYAEGEADDPAPFQLWTAFNNGDVYQKRELLSDLTEQCDGIAGPDEIVDVYPATPIQEGLMAITSRQSTAYVAQQVFRMQHDVDVSRLQRAWELLSDKLSILRTRIAYTPLGAFQLVTNKASPWEFVDDLDTYLKQDRSRPFSYGTPLHRQAIVQDKSGGYLVWTGHHAAYDGWSLTRVLGMLVDVYRTQEANFSETPMSRFVNYLLRTKEDATAAYWRDQLKNAQLTRFPALLSPTYQPKALGLVQRRLDRFRKSTSLGVLLRAAWAMTVAAYTGADEAIINVSLSGRDAPVLDIDKIVGPTITTVPVRIKINKEQTVDEFLATVDQQAKEMVPFSHAGLRAIRNALPGLDSDFDAGHLFVIQPAPTESESSGLESIGLKLETDIEEIADFGGYPLAVDCTVDANSVDINIRFDDNVLPQPRAAALLSQFEHHIRQLDKHQHRSCMADLDFVTPEDAGTIRKWNQSTPSATLTCIHDLVRIMVEKRPTSQAVCAWDGEFSYDALYTISRRLAHYLVDHCGVGPEVTVGLYMDKSCWAVVSILSILIAGGAVVPLGVQQPLTRVSLIAKDSGIRTILVDAAQATRLEELEGTSPQLVIVDETFTKKLPSPSTTEPICDSISPNNAAWVVYTSGSTGVPKGIVLEHKALCSSFQAHGPRVGFDANTRALQFSAFTFDNAIEDILSVLTFGGCVCVPSEHQRLNALTDAICQLEANLINTTSTVASLIEPMDVPMIKTLLLGGETISPAVVEQWLGHAKIINTYGPAECSVDISCSAPMRQPQDAYTIGHPLGVCFWVTMPSDYNHLVPVGTPGELLVEGPHLGRGYLNDPNKTAKSFVWDPKFVSKLGISSGRRMYRTGDIVQQNVDGSLIHLGRIDTQIKIRGQRVEPGEIESNIVRLQPKVRIACVDLIRPRGAASDPVLVAAVDMGETGHDENNEGESLPQQVVRRPTKALCDMIRDLRSDLLLVLPRYMVPYFVPMTSLPLNASSKLDRKATREILARLSREELRTFEKLSLRSGGRALSPMEDELRSIWVEVLGCSPDIGADDDFIQLGGDSVIAMRLVAATRRADIRIGVADVLQNPRLSDLARIAESYSSTGALEPDPAPFELWDGFNDADQQEQKEWLSIIADMCHVAPQDIEDVYPATPFQEGLTAVTAQQPAAYVAQNVFRMRDVDTMRFKEAWSNLIDSLSILRTRIVYHTARSGSVQVVIRKGLDWNQATDLQMYLAQDKAQPFAYGTPLHRLAIVKHSKDEAYFVWTQHHSGYDGYQMALTLNMLAQAYQDGRQPLRHCPPIPRFIKYLQRKDKQQTAAYWKQQLGGAHQTRFPSLPHPSYRPHADALSQRLMQRTRSQTKAPVAVLLRAAWAMTVATYTGGTEATSTVALSGRDIPVADIGNAVVPTLTTVPLRTRLNDREQLVSDLLTAMSRQSEEMKPFLHTGLQHIRTAVPELGVGFDPGHLFIVQPTMGGKDKDPLLAIGLEELATDKSDFGGDALSVECTVGVGQEVYVEMRYDSRLLPTSMAEALLLQFEHTLRQLETHGNTAIGDLDLLKPIDLERIQGWNEAVLKARAYQSCIHELVQTMVDRQPNAQAVTAWDGELSYAALSKSARRLAHHLVSLGVGPEVTVGVCMDKSLWAMVSILAILYSGGVVTLLGTQHPLSRIETIIEDADIRVTLVDKAQAKRLHKLPHRIVVDQSFINQLPVRETVPQTGVAPSNAAWIVYTSGSTGVPKGVVLEHEALCTGIIAHGTLFGNSPHTRSLQFASHTFGVAIEDMFTTLIFGGCTCIPSEDERLDISKLASAIRRMKVNFVNLTSTAASLLSPHDVPDIETVVLGGEAVRPAVVEQWTQHAKILNAYGQSECCVESVISSMWRGQDASKIGFPIAGCAAWVVDPSDYNSLVPVGAPGELLIQGPLLARGYLNDANTTAASFVMDPGFLRRFSRFSSGGNRMYRTGDLVQQNKDGSLVYLGRLDAQIKVRGQRVEPGEIENLLVQCHPQILQSFVGLVTPHDSPGSTDPVLVAALQFRGQTEIQANDYSNSWLPPSVRQPTQQLNTVMQEIRAALLQELPAYMVPSYFVPVVGSLPVNASGKLDRRASNKLLNDLSRDQLRAFSEIKKHPNRELSVTEHKLRAIYAEVLGYHVDDIGPDDRFIQLGGDSVAAMHIVAGCRQRGMITSVLDVLQKQTIAALALSVQTSIQHDFDENLDESSGVTDIQEWMLNYHAARPDVGMTYFALDASKPLLGERMVDACRKLFTTTEPFHTGFVAEDGKWKRVVPSPFIPEVKSYVTDSSIDEWTEDYMRREGFNPVEPGHPLASIAICTTAKQHRILLCISHAVWDGMIISKIWSSLRDLYLTGQTSKVASFSQYMAQVEKRRTPEASRYWSNLLKGSQMTPLSNTPHQDKEYVFRAGVIGPKIVNLRQNLPENTTCANLVKASWALVLARHSKSNDVVFADLVSGRAGVNSSVADAMGCCSTPMPVRVRLDPTSTYADLVCCVQKQQLASIPYETFGFSRIAQHCTDWPADTVATSWINHVPTRIASQLEIGDTEYTICQPKQEEQKWTFSEVRISYLHSSNNLEFSLAYAVEKISEETARRLYDDMVFTLEQILASPDALIGSQLS
ncbi:hypothetical protein BGZ63DRAFT_419816 [Mariannaea sp. PMI_226]|nr:hypothetical protein BGZ63DRAFT_419816 [Mariannaea sp. PMI_226]